MRQQQLQKDALGFTHSVIMGIAGTAPSFSISATMVTLIASVGILAPASLLYGGMIMFGITFAYMHLNRFEINAGAAYAWVGRIFNETLGFFAGWTLLVSSAIFMVSATIPAGNATLLLLKPEWVDHPWAVISVSLGWLLLVSLVVIRGIALAGRLQTVMTCLEILILLAFIGLGFYRFAPHALHRLSWTDLSITAFDLTSFASGAIIALYFFWGWDVALNLDEETRNAAKAPGLGAVAAMVIIIATFTAFSSVVLETLSDAEIQQSSTNILFMVADKLLPHPWSYLAVLALMLSTIGTLETSILQFTRTLFSQARAGAMHPRWRTLHQTWKTPVNATLLIAVMGALLLVTSLLFNNVSTVLKASINAIGVQAAYYYGLAGFACAWHFKDKSHGVWQYLTMVIWPGCSALALWVSAFIAFRQFDLVTMLVALGGILLGFIPLLQGQGVARSDG